MKYGIFGGAVNDGTVDDVVAEAASAERDGFASYWAPNIFGHDALTTLAIVGREVPRIELGTSVVPTYPRHPHAIAQQCHTVAAASGNRLTLGIGAGQMSRVVSSRIAAMKAADAGFDVNGAAMASDAFFPFRDGLDVAAEYGITAVIQPGGSLRDEEVVAAADEHGITMVYTGMRHFRH